MESCEGLALEYSAVAYCTGDGSCQNVELKNTAVAICPEKGACEGMTIGPDADCLKDGCPRHELGLDCTDQNVCKCPANGPCKDADGARCSFSLPTRPSMASHQPSERPVGRPA